MRALFVPLSVCLLLTGCALPLMQATSTQMMPGTPTCSAGTVCTGGMAVEIAKGVGSSIQNLTGLASADQPPGK